MCVWVTGSLTRWPKSSSIAFPSTHCRLACPTAPAKGHRMASPLVACVHQQQYVGSGRLSATANSSHQACRTLRVYLFFYANLDTKLCAAAPPQDSSIGSSASSLVLSGPKPSLKSRKINRFILQLISNEMYFLPTKLLCMIEREVDTGSINTTINPGGYKVEVGIYRKLCKMRLRSVCLA